MDKPDIESFPGIEQTVMNSIPGYMVEAMRHAGVEFWTPEIFEEFCLTYLGKWTKEDEAYLKEKQQKMKPDSEIVI